MSFQITEAFVQQYSSNVFHLSQQKGSRIRQAVRSEMQKGKRSFYDRLGPTNAVKKTSRHGDTPQIDSLHSRRACDLVDYEWADLIDDQDKIRMLMDPASPYVQSAMFAMGRSMDLAILQAARGNAYSGETGTTAVALPLAQKILAATEAAPATPTNLNVDTLRRIKKIFDAADVDASIQRYIAVTASQLYALLGDTKIASFDYNTVKALVNGEIDTFMGFKFIHTQQVETEDANYDAGGLIVASGGTTLTAPRRCVAWAGDGLMLAVGKDMVGKISERDDKSYATQVYACMSIGATRLEEAKVVDVVCKEA